jgi:hypothetical protein
MRMRRMAMVMVVVTRRVVMILVGVVVMAGVVAVIMVVVRFGCVTAHYSSPPTARGRSCAYAALDDIVRFETDAGKSSAVHLRDEFFRLVVYVEQRGRQHIAGRAHVQFQIQLFHLHDSILFIILAV